MTANTEYRRVNAYRKETERRQDHLCLKLGKVKRKELVDGNLQCEDFLRT